MQQTELIDNILCVFHRLKTFKASMLNLFWNEHAQSLSLNQVHQHVNSDNPNAQYGEDELHAAIDKMMDDNQLMLSDDMLFLI